MKRMLKWRLCLHYYAMSAGGTVDFELKAKTRAEAVKEAAGMLRKIKRSGRTPWDHLRTTIVYEEPVEVRGLKAWVEKTWRAHIERTLWPMSQVVLKSIRRKPALPNAVFARFEDQNAARRAMEELIDAGLVEVDAKLILRATR